MPQVNNAREGYASFVLLFILCYPTIFFWFSFSFSFYLTLIIILLFSSGSRSPFPSILSSSSNLSTCQLTTTTSTSAVHYKSRWRRRGYEHSAITSRLKFASHLCLSLSSVYLSPSLFPPSSHTLSISLYSILCLFFFCSLVTDIHSMDLHGRGVRTIVRSC